METQSRNSDSLINLLAEISQGNPGALSVIVQLLKFEEFEIAPFCIAMKLTNSKSYALWLVYKDMSKGDINKTHAELKKWWETSAKPLEVWCAEKGFR